MVKKPVSYREQLVLVEKSIERCKADFPQSERGAGQSVLRGASLFLVHLYDGMGDAGNAA